jgi:hypothetical protein
MAEKKHSRTRGGLNFIDLTGQQFGRLTVT